MKNVVELRELRAKAIEDARAITAKAESEDRNLKPEEQESYDRALQDAQDYKQRADRMESEERMSAETAEAIESRHQAGAGAVIPEAGSEVDPKVAENRAFDKLLMYGDNKLNDADMRALSQGTDSEGGFTVAPEDFRTQLIKNVDELLFMRSIATTIRLNKAKKLTLPTLADDISDADWTSELGSGNEDSDLAFGQLDLTPNPLAKRIKVSKTVLRNSSLSIQEIVRQRMAYKFALTEEKASMIGTGNNQGLGVFTASADGISTARDKRFDSATEIDADTIKTARNAIPQQYWDNLTWAMHVDLFDKIVTLKDTDGNYLYKAGITEADGDKLCGSPIKLSKFAPNTFSANGYLAVLGDFSHYYFLDDLDFEIQVLVEKYAEANQVGYIGRRELDCKPAVEEAFVRLQLAS